MKRHPTRNLRRQRQPCLVLGSLLVSSKACDGFCASRALRRAPRGAAVAHPRANAITPNLRITAANQFAATASLAAPILIQGGRLYESLDGQNGASESDVVEKAKFSVLSADGNALSSTTRKGISLLERIRILSYRTTLSASSLLISVIAICSGDVLSGTGVDGTSVVEGVESSVMPLTAGMTILLAPVPNNGFSRVISNSVGIATIVSAIASNVFEASSGFDDIQRILVSLCLASICIREIFYFGLAYKVEAAIALMALPFTLVMTSDQRVAEFSLPVCALAMDVLAAGKIFEPCVEDFERSNSEFLAGSK